MKKTVFFNDIPKLNLKEDDLSDWIHDRVVENGQKIKRLEINFISEDKMLNLNWEFLNHDNHTDILTFCYNDKLNIESEIFICFERALENAKTHSEAIEDEILRLISHGLLHVLGMSDNTQKFKELMTKEEDNFITKFHVKHTKGEKIL